MDDYFAGDNYLEGKGTLDLLPFFPSASCARCSWPEAGERNSSSVWLKITGSGDQRRHQVGVLALDRLIVVGVDDPYGHRNSLQLCIGEVGLGRPHVLDVSDELFELTGSRRELRVFGGGACGKLREDRASA